MKKRMSLLLAVILVLTAVLAGCGGGSKADAQAPVKEVVDGFMGALVAGEFDKLSSFCTEEAVKNENFEALEQIDKLDSGFLEALGVTEDALNDDVKASITGFIDTLKKEAVASYEIGDLEVVGDKANANGTVTFGYDTNMEEAGEKVMQEEMNGLLETYLAENQEELMKLYNEEGQNTMMEKMYNDMIPSILEKYLEAIRATEGGTRPFAFTLEKSGDAWLISNVDIILGNEPDSESETEGK